MMYQGKEEVRGKFKDYIECMNNKVDVPNFGTKEKTNEERPIDLTQLEEIENVFIINEQEQLIEEIESVEQVDEAQEIEEKEYLNSDSEAYNPKKGMAYLSELAEGGNEWAQLKMGCEYIKGKHVEKNYFQATEWLNKSAVQGNKYAEEILNDLNVRQLKTNRYGSQRRKRQYPYLSRFYAL